MTSAPTPFGREINSLLGWIQNEMGRGRLTGVQADFLNRKIVALERAHTLDATDSADAEEAVLP